MRSPHDSLAHDFSRRLAEACDQSPDVPDLHAGRYVAVASHLGVSEEAVRRWFAGETMPRRPKMQRLARFLGVDEGWLALGVAPEDSPRERRAWSAQSDGAVYVVFGLFTLEGARCAFPDEDDPRGKHTSIFAISHARQIAIYVAAARHNEDESVLRARFPKQYERSINLCVVYNGNFDFDLLKVRADVIKNNTIRISEKLEVEIQKSRSGYEIGNEKLPVVSSFSDLL